MTRIPRSLGSLGVVLRLKGRLCLKGRLFLKYLSGLQCLLGLSAAASLLSAAEPGGVSSQSVRPREDPAAVLRNPDMGWVLYENYPVDHRLTAPGEPAEADWSEVDAVAVMFSWADVERSEGAFDWTRVDAAVAHWRSRGKALHLRLSTEPLFGWSRMRPPGGMGIPDWLIARVPEGLKCRRTEGAGFGWHVDARHPLYQERLRLFLGAVWERFRGPGAPVLIDLRGFGRWGEWHSGFPYPTLEERRAALATIMDIWTAAFPGVRLALSYSHDPDGPPEYHAGPTHRFDAAATSHYDGYVRYSAFDLALQRPNITLRRDGAGGAVSSNERRLCEQAYREWRRAPQMSEFVGGYAPAAKRGEAHLRWLVDDALSLHPNYICLLGYSGRDAWNFLRERPELVAHGRRSMGYRLVPVRAELPVAIRAGVSAPFAIEWTNRAVGRALRDFELHVRLVDETGVVLAVAAAGAVRSSGWLQGETQIERGSVMFHSIRAGARRGRWQIALSDPATRERIALPLSERSADGFCALGEVAICP